MILLCRKSYIVWRMCRQCRQQRYGRLRRRGFQQRFQRHHKVKLHQLLLDQNYTKTMTKIQASALGMVSVSGFTVYNYHSLREFVGICMLGSNSEKGITNIFIEHCCSFTFKFIYQPLMFTITFCTEEDMRVRRDFNKKWPPMLSSFGWCSWTAAMLHRAVQLWNWTSESEDCSRSTRTGMAPAWHKILVDQSGGKKGKFRIMFPYIQAASGFMKNMWDLKETIPPDCVRCSRAQVAFCCTCGS